MRSKVTYQKGDSFKRIRVHEAGHVVAYYLLGYGVKSVWVARKGKTIDGRTRIAGFARCRRIAHRELDLPRTIMWHTPRSWKRATITCLAGMIAETYFFGKSNCADDSPDVEELDGIFQRIKHALPREEDETTIEATKWFSKPKYMKAVAAVANALKTKPRMNGLDVEKIIRSTGLKPLKKWKK